MAFFRYPGGKRKLVDPILEIIKSIMIANQIHKYSEAFFGGGCVGLEVIEHIPGVNTAHINDKNVTLASLWTAVMHNPDELIANIFAYEPQSPDFYTFKNYLLGINEWSDARVDILTRGFYQLAVSQMSFSGLGVKAGGPMGGRNPNPGNHHVADRWSPKYLSKKIRFYNDLFNRINIIGNRCTTLDFEHAITDEEPACLYLDPPYLEMGEQLYQHGFVFADHCRLAEALKSSPNPFVLSYDLQPEIIELYEWAAIYRIDANYTINGSNQKSELIIVPTSCRCHVSNLVRSGRLTILN